MQNLWTKHPYQTENPQGYWEHGLFAGKNSLTIMWYGVLGLVHAVFPFWFPFATSSCIIRMFRKLVDSKRHIPELQKYILNGYLEPQHLVKFYIVDCTITNSNEEISDWENEGGGGTGPV